MRKLMFPVIALVVLGVLIAPAPRKDQNLVATVLDQITPTAKCQQPDLMSDTCKEIRRECYDNYTAVKTFCQILTGDWAKCDKEFNESYRACAGQCW